MQQREADTPEYLVPPSSKTGAWVRAKMNQTACQDSPAHTQTTGDDMVDYLAMSSTPGGQAQHTRAHRPAPGDMVDYLAMEGTPIGQDTRRKSVPTDIYGSPEKSMVDYFTPQPHERRAPGDDMVDYLAMAGTPDSQGLAALGHSGCQRKSGDIYGSPEKSMVDYLAPQPHARRAPGDSMVDYLAMEGTPDGQAVNHGRQRKSVPTDIYGSPEKSMVDYLAAQPHARRAPGDSMADYLAMEGTPDGQALNNGAPRRKSGHVDIYGSPEKSMVDYFTPQPHERRRRQQVANGATPKNVFNDEYIVGGYDQDVYLTPSKASWHNFFAHQTNQPRQPDPA